MGPANTQFHADNCSKTGHLSAERVLATSEFNRRYKLARPHGEDTGMPPSCTASTSRFTHVRLSFNIAVPIKQEVGDDLWVSTVSPHSITIACLLYATDVIRRHILNDLNELFSDWLSSRYGLEDSPEARAFECLTFRQVKSLNMHDEEVVHSLMDLTLEQLVADSRAGTLSLLNPGPHLSPTSNIVHFYHKSRLRILDSVRLAFDFPIFVGKPVDVILADSLISSFSDVYSLLYYTRERLTTRHRILQMNPVNDIGVVENGYWRMDPVALPHEYGVRVHAIDLASAAYYRAHFFWKGWIKDDLTPSPTILCPRLLLP
jgi:hypothetical protein